MARSAPAFLLVIVVKPAARAQATVIVGPPPRGTP
jgi:hypothetical protein